MRKKTAPPTQETSRSRTPNHQGLIAKADMQRKQSATGECALDNLSHRTDSEFCCRGLPGSKPDNI
jgi:hypothetical protein